MSLEEANDLPRLYSVQFTDGAQADAEQLYLSRSQYTSPEEAQRWFIGIFARAEELSIWPRRFAQVEKSGYEGEIRRILYGKGRSLLCLFYQIIEPDSGTNEGVVRILRVAPAAQLFGPEPEADEENSEGKNR